MGDTVVIHLRRDCPALLIPSGRPIVLGAGTAVSIQQSLGGHYTVKAGHNLARIAQADADALGLISATRASAAAPAAPTEVEDVAVDPDEIRRQLSSCYDPEIPVDIVELGLVYDCQVSAHPDGGSHVELSMTLTAPGCGMGAVLAAEVEQKLRQVRGVRSARVRLVFDPPWDASRMSEVARLKLGLL